MPEAAIVGRAAKGYETVVKLPLGTGKVDANMKNNDGRTPLSWVVAEHGPIVNRLIASTSAQLLVSQPSIKSALSP